MQGNVFLILSSIGGQTNESGVKNPNPNLRGARLASLALRPYFNALATPLNDAHPGGYFYFLATRSPGDRGASRSIEISAVQGQFPRGSGI